jgi:hypothetical protein
VDTFSIFDWKKNEILTVGVILMMILGISTVQLSIGKMKARDSQRKSDVELVARALERYYLDYGEYPIATDGGRLMACGERGQYVCNWGSSNDSIVDYDNVEYLKGLSSDPFTFKGWKYIYETDKSRQKFKIYVALEYKRDNGIRQDLTVECGNGIQCNWYVQNE